MIPFEKSVPVARAAFLSQNHLSSLSVHFPLVPFFCPLSLSSTDAGRAVLGFDKLPWWGALLISLGCAILVGLIVWFAVCPFLKKKIERE